MVTMDNLQYPQQVSLSPALLASPLKVHFSWLNKLPVERRVMQPVPPVLGFGEDTQFEVVEQLQSPVCVTALPLPVTRCSTWASGLAMRCW